MYRLLITISLILSIRQSLNAQSLVYSFTDPCTKTVTVFTIPLTGTTTVLFLNKTASFTAQDVNSGVFGNWISSVYADYRKASPCSVQSSQVTQNQVTSNVVSSVVSSATSSATSSVTSSVASAASSAVSSSSAPSPASSSTSSSSAKTETKAESSTESSDASGDEVVSSGDDSGGDDSKGDSGGGNKSKGGKAGKASSSNPMIVASDLTTAQNLDKTFTPILNVGLSQSSLTGQQSWGLTGMVWMNFKQFALSGRYTNIKSGKVSVVNTYSFTSVYSYGNILAFVGYSKIIVLGKYGVTGFAVNAALSKIILDKSTFIAPSVTAFYTRPFQITRRLTISPELYVMSNPIMYSTKENVTLVDRSVGFFGGSGFDFQLSKKFKVNFNYKINASTKSDFPVLNFFLIGSKVNL